MLRTRIIPTLLLQSESLVKTVNFRNFKYVGDPCNTARIFNELEVDELLLLDIAASHEGLLPNFELLRDIANECFMPLSYGGGISSLEDAEKIFETGIEKIAINSNALIRPSLITEITARYGSQSVIVSIDVKRNFLGKYSVWGMGGRRNFGRNPVDWAKEAEILGAGEILVTSIDLEGTWNGFDCDLVSQIADAVSIPVIAHGGAGNVEHIRQVVMQAHASAVALGSMVVFQKKGMGVLVNFPSSNQIAETLA